MNDIIAYIVGIIGTISSIVFAYLAFKRNGSNDLKASAKTEGALYSDISYIKASIDRMERKLDKVENNYQILREKIIIVEQRLDLIEQRLNDIK
jgi:phage shock protein A